jgi:endonuclease YncB( thermonuclease family)
MLLLRLALLLARVSAAMSAPSGGWFSGVISGVSSGDSVAVVGKAAQEARACAAARAPRRGLTAVVRTGLAGAREDADAGGRHRAAAGEQDLRTLAAALRLTGRATQGRRDVADSVDEPHAWTSREFLRQKCIGLPCTFRVEYSVGGRDFASIFLGKEHLSLCVVGNGCARVRLPGGSQLPFAAELAQTEAAARAAGRGVWAKGDPPRRIVNDMTRDAQKAKAFLPFLQRSGRSRAQVDYVISGGRMKLLLDRDGAAILFSLAGVRCPRAPEAGAAEALAFQRAHLTHRSVEVEVESLEPRAGVFMGALHVPPPGGAAAAPRVSLALLLVQAGLAYVVSSADARPEARQLRAAEAAARAASVGLWKTYVAPEAPVASAPQAPVKAYVTVTEVLDGSRMYLQMRDDAELARMQAALADVAQEEGFSPAAGTLCCGRFTGDDAWYRAFVVSAKNGAFAVYFCDYGA